MPTTDTDTPNPFGSLADAAARASEAYDRKRAADLAWEIARDAVTVAYAQVELATTTPLDEPTPIPPDDGHVWQTLAVPVTLPTETIATTGHEPVTKPSQAERDAQSRRNGQASMRKVVDAKVTPGEAGGGPGSLDPLTPFQRRAVDATLKHRGDRKAAAVELGTKFYQSIDGALEHAGRKGVLPAELIPLLPARFAKFQGV